jgi:hypothetical protein
MRIKPGFELRNMCGENIIVSKGVENVNFSKIISLNESAAYLWQKVQDRDFDAPYLAYLLGLEYNVDPATALTDATDLLTAWQDAGLCE